MLFIQDRAFLHIDVVACLAPARQLDIVADLAFRTASLTQPWLVSGSSRGSCRHRDRRSDCRGPSRSRCEIVASGVVICGLVWASPSSLAKVLALVIADAEQRLFGRRKRGRDGVCARLRQVGDRADQLVPD